MYAPLLIGVFSLLTYSAGTQFKLRFTFCNQAPNPTLQTVCSQLKKWDSVVRHYHTTSLNESRPDFQRTPPERGTKRIWSASRSRWATNFQSWTAWSSWSVDSSSGMPQQRTPYSRSSWGRPALNFSHYTNLPMSSSLISDFTTDSKGPKRVALEIQYEISSLPRQPGKTRSRGGQVTNVKTYSHAISSLSSSSTSARREQILMKNEDFRQMLHNRKPTGSREELLWSGTNKKDLYSMEQDTVGPPGQQRPNNLIRKQSPSASPMIPTRQLPDDRTPDKSTGPPAPPPETPGSRPIKRNEASMAISSASTLMIDERLKTALKCMDLNCLCPFLHGSLRSSGCYLPSGKKFSKATRKEYRQLSTEERQRFHNALDRLKRSGNYDKIAQWHSDPTISGGAHSGPAFLPWHREYIKRLEIALRLIDPSVSLPYWDSTLESVIPKSDHTVLFSRELMGENDQHGNIINGFMSHWRTREGRRVTRHPGKEGRPLNEDDIKAVMRHSDVIGVLAYTAPQRGCKYPTDWTSLEYSHANTLVWIGGEMFHQTTSANDPLFFLHHAFVDNIWEYWRQHRQNSAVRSKSYPPDLLECSGENHFAQNPMRPFEPLRNIDGIRNDYNEKLYQYAPRPTCPGGQDKQCGSEFLFCDLSHGYARCSTKIRFGGNCSSYTHRENPCHNGFCQSGLCANRDSTKRIRSIEDVFETALITTTATTDVEKKACYNSHECCSVWASKGECIANRDEMLKWCPVSCHKCIVDYDFTSECSDRHSQCPIWAADDECQKNHLWMAENCRSSCRRCHKRRTDICQL